MANIFDIVNGDHTAKILNKTTISEAILVWRELLYEDPVCEVTRSDAF